MSSKKTINDFHRCIIISLFLTIVTFYLIFFSSLPYADTGDVHSIHGTVRINNLSENAIALIDVRAEEVIGSYPSVDTRVDADGHYSILVYESTYIVKCTVYLSYPENNSYSSFDYFIPTSQSVTKDTELNVTIPVVQFSGVVTDTAGKPVPGTTISGGGVVFFTGSDGRYQFDLLSGTHTFGVIPPPNSAFARTSITIKMSGKTVENIVLE